MNKKKIPGLKIPGVTRKDMYVANMNSLATLLEGIHNLLKENAKVENIDTTKKELENGRAMEMNIRLKFRI
jgi:hypothetical protein